jgi:hypothetical protein
MLHAYRPASFCFEHVGRILAFVCAMCHVPCAMAQPDLQHATRKPFLPMAEVSCATGHQGGITMGAATAAAFSSPNRVLTSDLCVAGNMLQAAGIPGRWLAAAEHAQRKLQGGARPPAGRQCVWGGGGLPWTQVCACAAAGWAHARRSTRTCWLLAGHLARPAAAPTCKTNVVGGG